MESPTPKLFTIAEANAAIPFLQKSLLTLQRRVRDIVQLKRQLEVLTLICGGQLAADNPDAVELTEKTDLYHLQIGEADAIIKEIRARGYLLRDVHAGIVDFYSRQSGRVVYLCWKKGENEVTHWHPLGEGYSKRQSLRPKESNPRPEG